MPSVEGSNVKKVVIACDAGMGSSVMLASQLKKQLKNSGVTVEHTPVNSIPADADVVLTHVGLADRARAIVPDKVVLTFQVYLGDPAFNKLVNAVKDGERIES
ncbi:MAG TPA: PTS lactose transporter subunit IIB [Actinomycetes bacterium]|jgi:mannitol-specific phosphotransferase system IIBC component|nr:PTS lactose transporter subunit IIB [Actinomycetes bacterium]